MRRQVVLGAGPLGRAVAHLLAARGDDVRVVTRSGRASTGEGVEVLAADVAVPEEAVRACDGAAVVYHCANPPYHRWPELHPGLMDGAIEGAARADARLVFGDNLYAYGRVSGPLTEDLPHHATGSNGRTRAEIAERLLAAHRAGQVRAAIGRGSDFFGPGVHQSAVGARVFRRALAGKPAQVLGDAELPHAVTYIEDFARALLALGEREEALGGVWHVPNDGAPTTREFVEMVFAEVGGRPRLRTAPWWGLAVAGWFNPELRAVREQLYQFERPWHVASTKFERAFGWKATPVRDAIHATVEWFRAHP